MSRPQGTAPTFSHRIDARPGRKVAPQMAQQEAYVANELASNIEPTPEVRFVPLVYTTPSQKRYGIHHNRFGRSAHAAAQAKEDSKESLTSLGQLWDWTLQHVIDRSISTDSRPKDEAEFADAIQDGLRHLLDGMTQLETPSVLEQWQDGRRLYRGIDRLETPKRDQGAAFDVTVVRFPLDSWKSNMGDKPGQSGNEVRYAIKYRYFGFRMRLGTKALDVGSIIKMTYEFQAAVQDTSANRKSIRRWWRDRAHGSLFHHLRYRRFERELDIFLANHRTPAGSPSSLVKDVKDEQTGKETEVNSTFWSRSTCSRPASTATASTCVATSPRPTVESQHVPLPWDGSTREWDPTDHSCRLSRRCSAAQSLWTDSGTLNEHASTTTLALANVYEAIANLKRRKTDVRCLGLDWNTTAL